MTFVPEEQKLVGHADREECTERLAQAVATGHLTEREFGQRRDMALEARTQRALDLLTGDLPPVPKPPEKRVKIQVAGNAYPFSAIRWIGGILLGAAMTVLPGPLWAAACGGFGHAPGSGALPLLTIMAGVVVMAVSAIAFSPDGYDRPERREYY